MVKPDKQVIIDAIIKSIEQGKDRAALLAINGKKWQLSRRTFDRYWKIANEQHIIKQQAIKAELAEVDKKNAIESRKKDIMAADDRKRYLTKIIAGLIKIPYSEVKYNPNKKKFEVIKFVEHAPHSARISAIAELNKMGGDYAPAKVAQTDTDGNSIIPTVMLTLPPGLDFNLPSNTDGEDEP